MRHLVLGLLLLAPLTAARADGPAAAPPTAASTTAAPPTAAPTTAASLPAASTPAGSMNDYPTATRADYVFACMTVNGGSQDALQRCSCSIDVIASIIPYRDYESAETVLRMRQAGTGYLAQEFRVARSNTIVDRLQEAQAEAEVRCF